METKEKKILVFSILGVLVMITLISGITYAWFSTNIDGSDTTINVTTAQLGPLKYTGTELTAENILPGWISSDATLTVEGTVTGESEIAYSCYIENTGKVSDVEYRISEDGESDSTSGTWTSISTTPIVSGSISETNASDTYKIGIRFKETGLDQNNQQNKTLSVKVYCKLDESVVRVSATTNDSTMATVVEPNTVLKNIGDSHTFTFNVTEGYEYKSVEGCTGVYNETNNTLTIDNIETSTTCVVNFEKITYEVNVTSTNESYGTVSPTTQTVEENGTATINLSPNTGYQYSSNTCGGTVSGNTMTISNITEDKTCTVTFAKPVTFTISSSGIYDTVNSETAGAACYYVRNYYGGWNYTTSNTTFSYTYNGTTYNNCKISGTPTCKYITSTSWTNGTSFNCASYLAWDSYNGRWFYNGNDGHYGGGCSATITCS